MNSIFCLLVVGILYLVVVFLARNYTQSRYWGWFALQQNLLLASGKKWKFRRLSLQRYLFGPIALLGEVVDDIDFLSFISYFMITIMSGTCIFIILNMPNWLRGKTPSLVVGLISVSPVLFCLGSLLAMILLGMTQRIKRGS